MLTLGRCMTHAITVQDMQTIEISGVKYSAVDLPGVLGRAGSTLPYSLRIIAENVSRQDPTGEALAAVIARQGEVVPFRPSRLILQDMLGLPLLVDLMAMRSAIVQAGGDPSRIDMSLPVDLVLDHSMTLEYWGDTNALDSNLKREFEINRERFAFMKACEARFPNLRVMPPGSGIIHQINLEFFGKCVTTEEGADGSTWLVPDTNFGTDSHTTMINGIGILGWGIGGLEAEAIMFGEASTINVPKVVGLEILGELAHSLTATDIALTVAEKLRAVGVVDCFVEMFGSGYKKLTAADRATIANMAPEYGSTCVYCPIDENTLTYLSQTGRTEEQIRIVEAYTKAQGLWFDETSRLNFDEVVTVDLSAIQSSISGPSRPEQRISLVDVTKKLVDDASEPVDHRVPIPGEEYDLGDDDVIIAAITSCTNTANPRNMILAGLVAKRAVEKGLLSQAQVKTSLAPGSRVVAQYLEASGLQYYLDQLGFHVAAFSCSTCNGMSGPLLPEHEAAIQDNNLHCAAVLSGNRNFAGRIHPLASKNVLASPPLVIAYALAGSVRVNVSKDPLGYDKNGIPVTLADLWPSQEETEQYLRENLLPKDFQEVYGDIAKISQEWGDLEVDTGDYEWKPSTNISWPGYLSNIPVEPEPVRQLNRLRPLVILGDSITTDHISPSGTIPPGSAAGNYLEEHGVEPRDFNAYGTRRGSSEVVIRSTFSNVRLRNEMTPEKEGSWTRLMPENRVVPIFEAIDTYLSRSQPLIVIAGQSYGGGSSRDTAAKAPWLAGVRAVVAESFERIHRSNLVNMGIAPLQFPQGVTRKTLGLDGSELIDIEFADSLQSAEMTIRWENGATDTVPLEVRIYNDQERDTFKQGGMLHSAFRRFVKEEPALS